MNAPKVEFFRDALSWRAWLEKNHDSAPEAWVGFYRKDSGRGGITYAEALDEALCFGWIDGVRKKVDAESYTNRFSPRRPGSYWSAVNTRRADELIRLGRMAPAGKAVFEARDKSRSERYSFERASASLDAKALALFRKNKPAWTYFSRQSPSYRKLAAWWVISAKQASTRARRLDTLIAKSAAGRRLM